MKVKSCPISTEFLLVRDFATADFSDAYEAENPQPLRPVKPMHPRIVPAVLSPI